MHWCLIPSTKNRSTDYFYEAFIDINYTLYTFCWTRTILGSSYKMSHAFHQEISAKFACHIRFRPYTKCEGRRFAMNIQKAFLRDFEAIMKIHVPLQLENNMKNVLDQTKLILALSKWQKNVLKMTTQINNTAIYENLLGALFTLLWHHDGQTHCTEVLTTLWVPRVLIRCSRMVANRCLKMCAPVNVKDGGRFIVVCNMWIELQQWQK